MNYASLCDEAEDFIHVYQVINSIFCLFLHNTVPRYLHLWLGGVSHEAEPTADIFPYYLTLFYSPQFGLFSVYHEVPIHCVSV